MPNPDSNIINEINRTFYNFLWEGTAKIKQTVIVKQYIEGGLKMINTKAFIKSLNPTWIRRLLSNNGNWTKIIDTDIDLANLINYGSAFTEHTITKISNTFWSDVLSSHISLLELNKIKSIEELLQIPIFQNKDIKIGGLPINKKWWNDKGVYFINDIVSNEGELLTETQFKNKYNIKTNFVEFNGIIKAIKSFAIKNKINIGNKKLQNPLFPTYIHIYLKAKKGCKDFHNILNNNHEKPTAIVKWEQVYNISEETWKDIFMSPFKYNYSSNLQWFQTRINHRILPTKKYLYTIKAIPSPICSTCDQEETITHLLWTCPITKSFLQKVQSWLRRRDINISFIEELFIFNIGEKLTPEELFIILEIKYYIFSAKKLNSPLSVVALSNRLKCAFKAIKYIATENNKLS